ncbi:MAG: ATP-binding protein [Patescibacteria group bacterium]
MFSFFALSGIFIVLTSAAMALLTLAQLKDKTRLIFGVLCGMVMLWGIGVYNIATAKNPEESLFWWRIAYVGVIFIPVFFTHFVHVFLEKKNYFFLNFIYFLGTFYLYASLFTEYFIKEVHPIFGNLYYLSSTPLYNSFLTLFGLLVIYCHVILYLAYRKIEGIQKQQIQYFFIGSFIGFTGGSFSFLPVYNINIYPYANIAVAAYPIIIGYAIFKYQLMNIKVLTTELFIGFLWVFIFVRALLAPFGSQEQIINILLLIMTIIVGVLLIRGVMKEVRSREQIQKLAQDLSKANARLKELDKMKSEFVSVASHQLRSPLTAIKGYSSLILEGSFGELTSQLKEPIERVFQASRSMATLIEDFLNISRIEQGRMKYQFGAVELYSLIAGVIREFIPNVVRAGLLMEFSADAKKKHTVWGDADKLRQVFGNLIDNAIKYTKRGRIMITLKPDDQKKIYLISIIDSGVGISAETIPLLFEKFKRSENANTATVVGTGLGLYIAKEMIRSHNGRIWVESPGIDQGSIFHIELNMASVADMVSSKKAEELESFHANKVTKFAEQM